MTYIDLIRMQYESSEVRVHQHVQRFSFLESSRSREGWSFELILNKGKGRQKRLKFHGLLPLNQVMVQPGQSLIPTGTVVEIAVGDCGDVVLILTLHGQRFEAPTSFGELEGMVVSNQPEIYANQEIGNDGFDAEIEELRGGAEENNHHRAR
jgi:hypothetical protein